MSNLKRYTLYILNIIDLLSIVLAHFFSYLIRTKVISSSIPFLENADYSEFLMLAVISYVVFNVVIMYNDDRFMERNWSEELRNCVKLVLFIVACILVYLYAMKRSESFSRVYVFIFACLLFVIDFVIREFIKTSIIPNVKKAGVGEDVLIVSDRNHINTVLNQIRNKKDWRYSIIGACITDGGKDTIGDVPVVSDRETMFEEQHANEYDSVLIIPGDEDPSVIIEWMQKFQHMGKTVHVYISEYDYDESYKALDRMGNTAIVTYRMLSAMPKREALFRRIISFAIALILLPVYLVFSLIVWCSVTLESPGAILIPRVRVGKNNRRFYQYRYRVYRMDAAERMSQGLSPFSHIGKFLVKTHLDGLPMVLNMLIGDMSLIGPKSPNVQRYLSMTSKERNTLSIPPGIIGYWSIEKDRERISEKEKEYIGGWNLYKDLYILVTTFARYISGHSLRVDGDVHFREEAEFVESLKTEDQPLEYDHSLYTQRSGVSNSVYLVIKRVFDIMLSLTAVVVLSPIFIILSILIMMDDGGNPFYGHNRIGKNGKRIKVYKFRSMRIDAGDLEKLLTPEQLEQYRKEFKIDNDPRITKIGEFIRRTSLDELPQLFNILGGSLSVIGPRPIVEDETRIYGDEIGKLLSVTPGLTGYWQAYARNNATYETGERQAMEMYYVDNQSLWLDIKIFFKTFTSVLKKDGAK